MTPISAALFPLLASATCSLAAPAATDPPPAKVRDRLWIWAHDASFYGGGAGLPGVSRITPVEGAFYMGLRNVMFIQYQGIPKAPFEQYFVPFKALDGVYWTLSNNGNREHSLSEEVEHVYRLAAENPNIKGLLLDDFLSGPAGPPDTHWLAANDAAFPVELTVTLPEPQPLSAVELDQSDWHSGDYRAAGVAVDVAPEESAAWREVAQGELPNEPGATTRFDLDGTPVGALRVRVLGSHDPGKARSCGLKAIRLLKGDTPLPRETLRATATSEYAGHEAGRLFVDTEVKGPLFGSQLSVEDLATAHQRMASVGGRRLDLAIVVYTGQLHPDAAPFLREADTILLWTWSPADLPDLETNLARAEALLPGKRILLGCYMWDFNAGQPMDLAMMEHQCSLGLKWLHEGRIGGMIFLGTNVCDLNIEAVEWTRKWIAEHGDEVLKP